MTQIAPAAPATARRPRIDILLAAVVRDHGSDLHLSPDIAPRARIDGRMRPLQMNPLSGPEIEALISEIITAPDHASLDQHHQVDFAYDAGELGRFRVNAFRQSRGTAAIMRLIPARIPTAAELNLPPAIQKLAALPNGLVLVTGPTGSGKSTTMAAVLDLINRSRAGHIITIEDPIEFVHPSQKCIVTQRQAGIQVHTFADALRAALRQDPDIISVGEMRDPETIQLALTAAETGHLVFGTLHTVSAIHAVNRIVDIMDSTRQDQVRAQLAETLRCVVSQRLIPRVTGSGRVAAYEVLLYNTAVKNNILKKQTNQLPSIIETHNAIGMQSLEQSLAGLVVAGLIDEHSALENANEPERLIAALNNRKQQPPPTH